MVREARFSWGDADDADSFVPPAFRDAAFDDLDDFDDLDEPQRRRRERRRKRREEAITKAAAAIPPDAPYPLADTAREPSHVEDNR
ncbi:MAG: hypothetical protein KY476_26220 [Planctomycetes bacterium]|nr:hypothetical protein [Planctomycetota bacterium]